MTNFRLLFLTLLVTLTLHAQDRPSTTANDASCDISTLPAATLLVPYFEVDVDQSPATATTTLVTITNVSREPQIAQVTLWTDLDYPILNFPVYLTGYDVSAFNLYDILARGIIEPAGRTTTRTTPGSRSQAPLANPRFLPSAAATCASLPGALPSSLMRTIRDALTAGSLPGCEAPVGRSHPGRAIGYVTVDLVATCGFHNAFQAEYWDELLYDNVLTGDWQIVRPNTLTGNYAEGEPAVHIRAVPEGGAAGSEAGSPFPFTFYDRFTPAGQRRVDRRQPLPSTFAARFIEGGTGNFETDLAIWREGTAGSASCGFLAENETGWAESVRFDERENPTVAVSENAELPVAASIPTSSELFPPRTSDVAGWLYLNLNNGGSERYSAASNFDLLTDSSTLRGPRQSQAWVTSRMAAEGRYAVAFQATALGNGCSSSPASPTMNAGDDTTIFPIGPARDRGDTTVAAGMTHRNDDSCDISVLPAATLLLPYFEVDIAAPPSVARTTLFTVTNVTNTARVAQVTLWTDWAFPVLSFNLYLTGYDTQSINLYDVVARGRLPGSGWLEAPNGERSLPVPASGCGSLPSAIPGRLLSDVLAALTVGRHSLCGTERIGGTHANAIGYATIDLVAACTPQLPTSAGYYEGIRFDNVLTGDYQHVMPSVVTGNYALGSPLVHIRAIPEGGPAGEQSPTRLGSTFYGRYQSASSPGRDRRQPLPSTFAARYIQGGGGGFQTDFLVWRDGNTGPGAACTDYDANGLLPYVEVVRFDERENPTTAVSGVILPFPPEDPTTPAASRLPSPIDLFPPLESGDVAGWMYFNLGKPTPTPTAAQAWITVTKYAEGRYAVADDAIALGNGCSPVLPVTTDAVPIGPAPND